MKCFEGSVSIALMSLIWFESSVMENLCFYYALL
jgi:hypothetical protein